MHQLRSVISYPPVALQQGRSDTIRTIQNLISPSALRFVVLCKLYEQNSLYSPFAKQSVDLSIDWFQQIPVWALFAIFDFWTLKRGEAPITGTSMSLGPLKPDQKVDPLGGHFISKSCFQLIGPWTPPPPPPLGGVQASLFGKK